MTEILRSFFFLAGTFQPLLYSSFRCCCFFLPIHKTNRGVVVVRVFERKTARS